MKNLFVLPTDKPSRLFIYDGKLGLAKGFQYGSDAIQNQKIYITNEEEIKEGDWFFEPINNSILKLKDKPDKLIKSIFPTCKKIILTTDQDLINDDVQAIPDEFLEWFVKNPSCEEVEVKCYSKFNDGDFTDYKIIISKKEAKQETTLEEVAKKYFNNFSKRKEEFAFIDGAKWQQEQDKKMYSEEDMHNLMDEYQNWLFNTNDVILTFREWFKQFKK